MLGLLMPQLLLLLLIIVEHLRKVKREENWAFRAVIRAQDLNFVDDDAALVLLGRM